MNGHELIARWFTHHPPAGDQPERYQLLRQHAHGLATLIYDHTPPSQERDIAIMHLREAVMWANAAIACNEIPGDTETPGS